jgi:adenine-specific DNA-methyltransferase
VDATRSYGDVSSGNRLYIGDNLRVLRALRASHEGTFRCAYLDPPFNTGRAFAEYCDRHAHGAWEDTIAPRLEALAPLIASEGSVFAEIDDTELGTLQRRMDDAFGRENRVSIVTVVRSASTGHKAINRGPVNVTDFILVYAKDKARWRCTQLTRARRSYDTAYRSMVENHDKPVDLWAIVPLARHVARSFGHANVRDARRVVGKSAFEAHLQAFALENAHAVCRFAQPRFEAVSHAAQALIVRSRQEPERVFRLERTGHPEMLFKAGNRIVFLANKLALMNGVRTLVEPLTNVWDDIPFQGIAREGGVVFSRNKKPERLLERILKMATEPGDSVLDPYLGSGTTAAVALKMGRRWVGIEDGAHVDTTCIPRLRRVVDGTDKSGVARTHASAGGSGFAVYR